MNSLIIAEQFHQLAKLMELHQENVFKVKAISNAASILEKLNQDINLENYHSLAEIKGIGKNILQKINEVLTHGKIIELEEYENKTPETVIELLNIRGLGPSKVFKLWKELNIVSVEELIYACKNNLLKNVKGFGEKTQQTIYENVLLYLQHRNKLQLGIALSVAEEISCILQQNGINTELTGELRRQCEVVNQIEFITTDKIDTSLLQKIQQLSDIPVVVHTCKREEYVFKLFETTGSSDFLEEINFYHLKKHTYKSEEEIFNELKHNYLPAFQRECSKEYYEVNRPIFHNKNLIQLEDFKGILHCHTQYSDGLNTIDEFADFVRENGCEYFGICDHSQSAKYANGLSEERVFQQFQVIDKYNKKHKNFRILKGIESDILKDGSLDYSADVLSQFDFVVASIHNHFDMNEEEATKRLIKAIENPYTTILGHLTGRLLLIRRGYPVNHKKIIDACAANNVVIELNANTYRLDIDWRWLQYCMHKGVKIAINPDAHEKTAIKDIQYGVMVAQKAGLTKEFCINTMSLKELLNFLKHHRKL
ncbi:MAG: DNA polymerase/3'-5' exonuclease PolX [Bacteroidia bacterium]|nr:MAG: DNA polymerase/3'-5' exonuclease PolX [Bacteroidia bacterium]